MTPEEINKATQAQREAQRAAEAAYSEQLRKLSNEQLRAEDLQQTDGKRRSLLEAEIRYRAIKQHWTLTPGFVVLIVATVFSGIAAGPIVHGWLWPRAEKNAAPIELAPAPQIETRPNPSLTPSNAKSQPLAQSTSSPFSTPIPGPEQ